MSGYRSITRRVRAEPEKTKGSRHIATLVPIGSAEEVEDLLDELRGEFPIANHHAYAWRLGRRGERSYYSDDGEPSGSAGRPILQYLEGRDITQVVLVVSRIFGGTKLGVGGLVRAYGGAAAAALDAAEIVEVFPKVWLRITYPYACSNRVRAIAHARDVDQREGSYGAEVNVIWQVLESEADAIAEELREGTAGQVSVERCATP